MPAAARAPPLCCSAAGPYAGPPPPARSFGPAAGRGGRPLPGDAGAQVASAPAPSPRPLSLHFCRRVPCPRGSPACGALKGARRRRRRTAPAAFVVPGGGGPSPCLILISRSGGRLRALRPRRATVAAPSGRLWVPGGRGGPWGAGCPPSVAFVRPSGRAASLAVFAWWLWVPSPRVVFTLKD